MVKTIFSALVCLALAATAAAQSQAINGTIEGTVTDESGRRAAGRHRHRHQHRHRRSPRRSSPTRAALYRAPLLPLGTYRVTAELQGFKKFEQTGITLSAGQTAVINVKLGVGARDARRSRCTRRCAARRSRQDRAGPHADRSARSRRCRSPRATRTTSRCCSPASSASRPRSSACRASPPTARCCASTTRSTAATTPQKDRAGLRQMPMSEVMIREVKVVTTGYAPEFGQTMGLVYNAITPSGTNTLKGQGSYRFQRKSMVELPFFVDGRARRPSRRPTSTSTPSTSAARSSRTGRTSSAATSTPSATSRACASSRSRRPTARALGLTEPRLHAGGRNTEFAIGKVDHQLERGQPPVGALHLLRQLHHRQRRRRPRARCSAAPTSPIASTRRRASWSRRSAQHC